MRQCGGTGMLVGTRHFTTWPLWFRCEDKVSISKAIRGFYVLLPLCQIWFYGFFTLASALIPQDLKAWPLSASCSVIKQGNWHKRETFLKNIYSFYCIASESVLKSSLLFGVESPQSLKMFLAKSRDSLSTRAVKTRSVARRCKSTRPDINSTCAFVHVYVPAHMHLFALSRNAKDVFLFCFFFPRV